jgi:stage III sporulation protein AF
MKGWIINIVTTMVFVAFVEVLLPGGNMRKYVNLVIGLLVMLVIISPLIHLSAGSYNLGIDIFNKGYAIELRDANLLLNNVRHEQRESITKIYRDKVQRQIQEHVERLYPGSRAAAEVYINEDYDSESYGSVLGIRVVLSPSEEARNVENGIEIGRIIVDIDEKNPQDTVEVLSREHDLVRADIAGYLSEIYRIPGDQIEIIFKDK